MNNTNLIKMKPKDIEKYFLTLKDFFSNENYMLYNVFHYYEKYINSESKDDFYNFHFKPYENRVRISKSQKEKFISENISFSEFLHNIVYVQPLFEKYSYDPFFMFDMIKVGFQLKERTTRIIIITSILNKDISNKLLNHKIFKNLNVTLSNVETLVDFYIPIMANENYIFDLILKMNLLEENKEHIFNSTDIKSIKNYLLENYPVFKF